MAAACNVVKRESGEVNAELLEAHIVAQAITELQEIQAPGTQAVPGVDDVVLTDEVESDIQGVSGQTRVIYYIEDGTVSRTEDRTLVDSSVQANDYEIERRSGKLPARKRVIPFKFRDYKNNSNDEDSDSDFDPHEYLKSRPVKRAKVSKTKTSVSGERAVGRPRKNYYPSQIDGLVALHDGDISNKVEKLYQEALQLTHKEILDGEIPDKVNDGEAIVEHGEVSELDNGGDNQSEDKSFVATQASDEGSTEQNVEKVSEENEQSKTVEEGHRMTTRGKRVPVYGSEFEAGALSGRGRGRPRLSKLPFYKCAECGKIFKQKGNLKTHLRLHVAIPSFRCTEEGCDKTYRSNESLRRHLLTHQGIKPFQCNICEQRFSSNVALTEHRSRHSDERPYQCPHCQKCFRQISCFKRHVVIHSGELPYSCTICHKKFAQTAYLKSHMKVHTGEKPYQCMVCFKRFAHQSDVKRHSTTHTGEKRYSCSKCQAMFSDVSSKNRHEREHENNKRYTCTLCNDTFKRPGQLRSHLNKKHSVAFPVTVEKAINNGMYAVKSLKINEEGDSNLNNLSQQRIVSLIKNLHSKAIPNEGIIENVQLTETEIVNQPHEIVLPAENVTDISQLEKEVDASIIEGDIQVPIELQGVEIHGDGSGQTFIAIADLADSLSVAESDISIGQMRYRVLYEIDDNGEQKQILVPYHQTDEEESIQVEYSGESMVTGCVSEDRTATETIIETIDSIPEMIPQSHAKETSEELEFFTENNEEQKEGEIKDSTETTDIVESAEDQKDDNQITVASGIDYVNSPDFSKQEYYNWLTNFTEYCKVVPMPLDVSLFQKISQVHKTLSDVMATPCGVVADKENFRVLMNISKELSTIINEHLVYVLENLKGNEKQVEGDEVVENE